MTTWYFAANRGDQNTGDITVGTSSTAGDDMELRVDALDANSVALTKLDVINFLRQVERYIVGNWVPAGSPGTDMPPL